MKHGEQEEAVQYGTLAVQIAGKTGTSTVHHNPRHRAAIYLIRTLMSFRACR